MLHSDERLAYSVDDAAELAGICRDRIYTAIKEGGLKARRYRRRTLILHEDLVAWLRGLEPVELGHGDR